ncbi:hypothetical protein [Saccharothrix sp. Mg75]|uniref:hypothetical protein n=1 Tax=Saccharothrix sp. Mg75 TaxID=3445357 RepID=UPI003EEEB022
MPLASHPLDDATANALVSLAGASWERDDLDASWVAAGLPATPVAWQVHEEGDYRLVAGDRAFAVGVEPDPERVTAFAVAFAVFLEDAEGEEGFFDHFGAGWSVDGDADRDAFDALFRAGVERVAARLGEPLVTGTHDEAWHHAAWRAGDCLLVVAQGEDFDSYGVADDAKLWLVRHPADRPVPEGDALYALLCGDATPV